jgi:hypothetical protein
MDRLARARGRRALVVHSQCDLAQTDEGMRGTLSATPRGRVVGNEVGRRWGGSSLVLGW